MKRDQGPRNVTAAAEVIALVAEINGAAAARELEIKEGVEVVHELGDHCGGEIPHLVPIQRRSLAELKNTEQRKRRHPV